MRSKGNPHRFGTAAYWRAEFLQAQVPANDHNADDGVRAIQAKIDQWARDAHNRLIALERKHKARKGEIEELRAWAVWLLESCLKTAVAPPRALVDLMQYCAGNPPAYYDAFAKNRIRATGASPAKWEARMQCIQLDGESDSDLPIKPLAKEVGVSRRTVSRWRGNSEYRAQVAQLRATRRGANP